MEFLRQKKTVSILPTNYVLTLIYQGRNQRGFRAPKDFWVCKDREPTAKKDRIIANISNSKVLKKIVNPQIENPDDNTVHCVLISLNIL